MHCRRLGHLFGTFSLCVRDEILIQFVELIVTMPIYYSIVSTANVATVPFRGGASADLEFDSTVRAARKGLAAFGHRAIGAVYFDLHPCSIGATRVPYQGFHDHFSCSNKRFVYSQHIAIVVCDANSRPRC